MDNFPNFTYRQLAELILAFDMHEGLSPAALGALQAVAQSAINVASQHSVHPTALCAGHSEGSFIKDSVCQTCGLPVSRIG